MTDVPIDEMLEWLSLAHVDNPLVSIAHECGITAAISAILEQHRSQTKFLNTLDAMHIKAVEQRAMEAVLELERVKAAKLEDITVYGYKMNEVVAILEQLNKPGVSMITEEEVRLSQLEAIRTFVEEVDIHFRVLGRNQDFSTAMRRELAIMEREFALEETE